jgi:hypothetical protein
MEGTDSFGVLLAAVNEVIAQSLSREDGGTAEQAAGDIVRTLFTACSAGATAEIRAELSALRGDIQRQLQAVVADVEVLKENVHKLHEQAGLNVQEVLSIDSQVRTIQFDVRELENNLSSTSSSPQARTAVDANSLYFSLQAWDSLARAGLKYAGRDSGLHPRDFITSMERNFEAVHIPPENRLTLALQCLVGTASQWANENIINLTSYDQFKDAFLGAFWGHHEQGRILRHIYGGSYEAGKKSRSEYFAYYCRVAQHLDTPPTEKVVIEQLVSHFHREVKVLLWNTDMSRQRIVDILKRLDNEDKEGRSGNNTMSGGCRSNNGSSGYIAGRGFTSTVRRNNDATQHERGSALNNRSHDTEYSSQDRRTYNATPASTRPTNNHASTGDWRSTDQRQIRAVQVTEHEETPENFNGSEQ